MSSIDNLYLTVLLNTLSGNFSYWSTYYLYITLGAKLLPDSWRKLLKSLILKHLECSGSARLLTLVWKAREVMKRGPLMSVLECEKLFHKSLCHSRREKQVIERNRRAKLNSVSEATNRHNSVTFYWRAKQHTYLGNNTLKHFKYSLIWMLRTFGCGSYVMCMGVKLHDISLKETRYRRKLFGARLAAAAGFSEHTYKIYLTQNMECNNLLLRFRRRYKSTHKRTDGQRDIDKYIGT